MPRSHSVSNNHAVTGRPSVAHTAASLLFWLGTSAKRRMLPSLFTSQMTFAKKEGTGNEMKNGVCALLYYIVHLITVLWNCIFSRFAMAGGDWSSGYVRRLRVKSVKRSAAVPLRPRDLLDVPNTCVKDKTTLESRMRSDMWPWREWRTSESGSRRFSGGDHRDLSSIYFSLHLFSVFGSAVCCTL